MTTLMSTDNFFSLQLKKKTFSEYLKSIKTLRAISPLINTQHTVCSVELIYQK